MIKKLGVLLLLGVLGALGLKGYVSYSAMQFVEQLKQKHSKVLSLSYSWLSADFDGTIHFENVVLTPYSLKRPMNIERFTLNFGDVEKMFASAADLQAGRLRSPIAFQYSGLTMPLTGRTLEEWLATFWGENALILSKLYQCGERSHLDFAAMKAMGIDELLVSGGGQLAQLEGKDEIDLEISIKKFGKLSLFASLDQGRFDSVLKDGSLEGLRVHEFSVSYQDGGYYRRLINMCTAENALEPEMYAALSSQAWRVAMGNIGVILNEEAQVLYRDRIIQGGVFSLSVEPKKALRFDSLEYLYDQELVTSLGISVVLNGERRDNIQAFLDGKFYRPAPVVEEKKVEPTSLQATVTLGTAGFKPASIAELPELIDRKVKIQLHDGKSYKGLLKSADENKIEVTLIFDGGTADYFFANEKIELVEVWR